MYTHVNNLFLLPLGVDFYFCWFFGNRKCKLKLHSKRNLITSKKSFLLCQKVGDMALLPPLPSYLYADPVYLFTVFLFYLYSCANIIAKLITKAKPMAIIET